MKRLISFCLLSIAGADAHATASKAPQQPAPAFTAVIWTTTTLHSPSGKAFNFMRRTVYSRDASGKVHAEIYRPTRGLEHDTTAPLEHVLTSPTATQALPQALAHPGSETLEQQTDLGTQQISGLPSTGKRMIFRNASGQRTRTLETWFSPALGLTVHMASGNTRGDSVVSDLSELRYGSPYPSIADAAPATTPAVPLLTLYRALFTHIAHMERDRLADDPNRHVNMAEIEDHLRNKLGLSPSEWQILVQQSVEVEQYTREASSQAHSFADQDRAARRDNPLSANTLSAGRATLHKMQTDLNTHVQGEVDKLNAVIGPGATKKMQTYLQGPMAASVSSTPIHSVALQARRADKEQAQ